MVEWISTCWHKRTRAATEWNRITWCRLLFLFLWSVGFTSPQTRMSIQITSTLSMWHRGRRRPSLWRLFLKWALQRVHRRLHFHDLLAKENISAAQGKADNTVGSRLNGKCCRSSNATYTWSAIPKRRQNESTRSGFETFFSMNSDFSLKKSVLHITWIFEPFSAAKF